MDARIRMTKKLLRDALSRCMEEKPLKDITVTEVCALAGINRATFYNHYSDCHDIIDEVEQEQLDEFRELLNTRDKFGDELISDVLAQIDRCKESSMAPIAGAFSKSYISEMAEIAAEYAFDDWRKRMPEASEEEVKLALTAVISASIQIITKEAGKTDRWTIVRFIKNMIIGTVSMYSPDARSDRDSRLRSLASQYEKKYEAVMIADLNTGLFGTVSAKEGVRTDAGPIPFSEAVLKNVLRYVHEADKQTLADAVGDFGKIKREYAVGESRDIRYRSSNGSEYLWYCMTLNRISENELLIALRNCNDEVVAEIVDEKLLEKYEAVYLIDLNHNEVRSAKPSKISKVGAFTGKVDYTTVFLKFAETVAPQYRQSWVDFSDPEYMKRYMAELDMREFIYELPAAEKKLRRVTIDVTERVNGEASTLLLSFAGIDDISARAMLLQKQVAEQNMQLRKSLAFTNFFLDTYVSAYYVDLDDQSCEVYKRTEELERDYPIVTNYLDSMTEYINRDVHPEDREMLFDAVSPKRMKAVLSEKPEYSHIFRDISGGVEKTYRMQVIRGAEDHHAAFGFIDISDEAREQSDRLRAAEEANKLVDNISAQYSVAFTVNMTNGKFKLLRLDRILSGKFEPFTTYSEAKSSLFSILHSNDRERIMNELSFDTIREQLKGRKSYSVEYRTCIDGSTKWHEMRVTAVDADEVAMGFAEKDLEITKRRLEEMRYDEYLALFTVDLDTAMIKPLKTSALFKTVEVGKAAPYEYGMRLFARTYEGPARDFFTEISDIENVRNEFATDDKRTFSYKSTKLGGDKWIDVVSYVILRHGDGTPAMITIGFSVVDALATARKELLSRLTENMQMIGGLASGYDALYYINIDEGINTVYTLNEEKYPDSKENYEKEADIYTLIKAYGQSDRIHPDDRHIFDDFCAAAIREKLTGCKKYSVRFRFDTGSGYRWDEMDFIKYENADEPANAVAIGFADRDTEIRSEQAINSSFDVLGQELPPDESVSRILSIAGEYYGADRCYVFEYSRGVGLINNTYEWCAGGIEPMIEKLQDLPIDVVEGWNREFGRQGAFYMDALDSEHNTEETVAILEMQGIESLVAAPLMNGDEIAGFIGVDNPTKAKKDISILEKASAVIYSEILKRKENDEEHVTLAKLTDAFLSVYYTDLSTDYMHTWKMDEDYVKSYGAVQNYSVSMGGYVRENIAERDRERCILMTSPEYVLEQFRTRDQFSIDMTDIMLGYERSVVFDYIKVSEDGKQFVICCRDVTDTLAREKEQQKILQDALQIADAANRSKTDFLFSMSHDIRTPMNAITGFTNMAVKHIDNREKVLDCLGKTQKAGMMLLSLINSILEVSRIESGHATLEEQPGDVYYSFTNIESTMREMAETKDIDLSFEFGDIADRFVFADFSRCMRVFVNVISNAIKYTKEGGFVRVRCEQLGAAKDGRGSYRYTVTDNGIGMSEEFQKHIFEQFARENTATVSGIQGSGLGMSVVKSFVDLMGGTVNVVSRQGEGSTFTIVLPFRIQEREDYTDPVTGEIVSGEFKVRHAEQADFTGKNVLLVEDNELNREIAIEILEEEGMLVEDADDGTTAVEAMKAKGPDYFDFILMDIQMPVMNGYEATKVIRAMYPDKHIPIVALSANAFAEDKKKSLEVGMDDHVAKPINIKELLAALAKFL